MWRWESWSHSEDGSGIERFHRGGSLLTQRPGSLATAHIHRPVVWPAGGWPAWSQRRKTSRGRPGRAQTSHFLCCSARRGTTTESFLLGATETPTRQLDLECWCTAVWISNAGVDTAVSRPLTVSLQCHDTGPTVSPLERKEVEHATMGKCGTSLLAL